jgi:peptidoglycan/xylan/chitin deacetylase (PgdA/CDA1 family)
MGSMSLKFLNAIKYDPRAMSVGRFFRDILAGFLGLIMIHMCMVEKVKSGIKPGYILPLCFHKPRRNLFEKVILWLLKNGYRFISSEQLLEILQGGIVASDKLVWITFDDGWRDNIQNVLPLLIEYSIPATFFITTAPVESPDGQFWFSFARKNRAYLPLSYRDQVEDLWKLTESDRNKIIKSVKNRRHAGGMREAMTIPDIQALALLSKISIGVHTDNHPVTSYCTEEELEEEISSSKRKLEAWIGKKTTFFAYPKGVDTGNERGILQKHGFNLAAILETGFISPELYRTIDVYRIPRTPIPDTGYFTEIECHLVGVWQPFMHSVKSFFRNLYKSFYRATGVN